MATPRPVSETRRSASADRLRGRKLQAIRWDWFQRFPLCVHCQAKTPPVVRAWTQLDHIKPLEDGGDDFDCDDEQNRQGLCDECHGLKTAKDMGHRPHGCDADGMPTDPRHPWNEG
jgi:5-methylcytosine-specific restriction enzyme A